MSKEVTRYDLRVTDDGAGLYATDEPNTNGMQYVSALDYDALLAERDALEAENKRLHLMVAQADHNYDMDRNRMMYLLRTAHDCLEQWNLKYPRLARRGEEFSSEHTYRQIRAFVPEYREADAALQGEQPCSQR